jgi:parallel beta-helix repeat protein
VLLNLIKIKLASVIIASLTVPFFCAMTVSASFAFPVAPHIAAPYFCLRHFYVNIATGVDVATQGTQASPWKTIQFANDSGVLKAGDCVHVAAGTYYPSNWGLNLSHGGNTNTATGYVTYIGAPNWATHLKGSSYSLVTITAPYVVLDGFNVDSQGIQDYAIANSTDSKGVFSHHLRILNNLVHDSGGGGIGLIYSDYLTISGNTVYNTSGRSAYQESGISIWHPRKIAGFQPKVPADLAQFHIVISENVTYDNKETAAILGQHTDGNGIIVDDWLDTQDSPSQPYTSQALVQGNLSFNNGGRGIEVFLSTNVTVANNTCYNNNLDMQDPGTWRGELASFASSNITWINNIAWTVPAPSNPKLQFNTAMVQGTYGGWPDNNVVWTYNITFDGTSGHPSLRFDTTNATALRTKFLAANKTGVNPILTTLKPATGSPAIRTGTPTPSYPPMSLEGTPMTSPPNIGAY